MLWAKIDKRIIYLARITEHGRTMEEELDELKPMSISRPSFKIINFGPQKNDQ